MITLGAIRGRANAFVRKAGMVKRAQDRARPTHLDWDVETSALARTMLTVTPSTAPACVCPVLIRLPPPWSGRLLFWLLFFFFSFSVPFHKQQQATSATTARIPVQRGFTDTIVPTSALVKTEATAQIRTDNANVLSDGPVSCVNLRAGPAFTGRIARSNVTVKTELLAIT